MRRGTVFVSAGWALAVSCKVEALLRLESSQRASIYPPATACASGLMGIGGAESARKNRIKILFPCAEFPTAFLSDKSGTHGKMLS